LAVCRPRPHHRYLIVELKNVAAGIITADSSGFMLMVMVIMLILVPTMVLLVIMVVIVIVVIAMPESILFVMLSA